MSESATAAPSASTAHGRAHIEHYIVEHDTPADALQTARNSMTYLEGLSF